MRSAASGLTLVELLIAIGIAAAVAMAGLPALGDALARQRLRAEINALHHALHRGRRESIRANRRVVLCPTRDGRKCGDDWQAGWMLFIDDDASRPPERDRGERLLTTGVVRSSVALSANRRAFVFRTRRFRSTNGTFTACDRPGRVAPLKLIVSYTGRPRTDSGEPGDCMLPY